MTINILPLETRILTNLICLIAVIVSSYAAIKIKVTKKQILILHVGNVVIAAFISVIFLVCLYSGFF